MTRHLLLALSLCITSALHGQLIGGEAFLQGNFVEAGISACGSFGTNNAPPAGYHPNAPGGGLGYVADLGQDGWATGTPPFMGDYFLPGSPVEGFGLEFNGSVYLNGNDGNICDQTDIPGSVIDYTATATEACATWQGTVANVQITIETCVPLDELYFTSEVTICNNSTADIYDIYFLRHVDPDNEQTNTGDYTTDQEVLSQPDSTTCEALIGATGQDFGAFLGLGAIDPDARVAYGGFSLSGITSIQDVHDAVGVHMGSGTSTFDEAIDLTRRTDTLLVGDCESFSFAYILDSNDIQEALNAVSNVQYVANGTDISATGEFNYCLANTDTVTLEVTGGSDWTWSTTSGSFVGGIDTGFIVQLLGAGSATVQATGSDQICGNTLRNLQLIVDSSRVTVQPTVNVACGVDSTLVDGTWYVMSTTVRDTFASSLPGCDSLVITDIIFPDDQRDTVSVQSCDSARAGSTWFFTDTAVLDTVPSTSGCDTIRWTLIDIVASGRDTTSVTACDSALVDGTWYTASTILSDTTAFGGGCDSISVIDITIQSGSVDSSAIAGCDSALVNGVWYTASTTVRDTVVGGAASGCDSISIIDITVDPSRTSSEIATGCDSVVAGGIWFSSDTVLVDTLVSSSGCDSIHTITVQVAPSVLITDTVSGCDSVIAGGSTLTADTILIDSLTTGFGCDSVRRTVVRVPSSSVRETTITACDSAIVNGTWYTSTQLVIDSFIAVSGCDSIVRTDLTVSPTAFDTVDVFGCDSVLALGSVFFASDTVIDTLPGGASSGCDSITRWRIEVRPSVLITDTVSGCDSVIAGGSTLTADTILIDSLTTGFGCDSVRRTVVRVPSSSVRDTTITACDSAIVNGTWYTSTQLVIDSFIAVSGCDSIVRTDLTVRPTAFDTVTRTGCDSVLVNGVLVFSTGVVRDTLTAGAANGCDSITVFDVTVHASARIDLALAGCDSVWSEGQWFTNSEVVVDSFTTVNGCDSIRTRTIDVFSSRTVLDTVRACDSADVNGTVYRTSGTVVDSFTTSDGCDSIVRTDLTIDTVRAIPNAVSDTVVCLRDLPVLLDVSGYGGVAYRWDDGTTTAFRSADDAGRYIVDIDQGTTCTATDTITVDTVDCVRRCFVGVPTGFTPDGDGTNDVFRAVTTCADGFAFFRLQVWNGWGGLVFETEDPDRGWDGTIRSSDAPMGVYTVIVEYVKNGTEQKRLHSGTVTLVR